MRWETLPGFLYFLGRRAGTLQYWYLGLERSGTLKLWNLGSE
ncbi:5369_t:CDS:2, partial [Funneliformis mosseae]